MQIVYMGANVTMLDEWKNKSAFKNPIICYDIESLNEKIKKLGSYIIIADYDSVAHEINKFISSNTLPKNVIVLEKVPDITTGKMLITRGIKAYGNSRMLSNHYEQMIQTVMDGKIWTYPELTIALAKHVKIDFLNDDSVKLIEKKLTHKEAETVYLILKGLTNDAIAEEMNITTRTVKANVSSIFKKLHVNDRLSLVLLLK
jgi:DNA-binding NarL/FixJ family response regulator